MKFEDVKVGMKVRVVSLDKTKIFIGINSKMKIDEVSEVIDCDRLDESVLLSNNYWYHLSDLEPYVEEFRNMLTGQEALIALANGESVEYLDSSNTFKVLGWVNAMGLETHLFFSGDRYKFRIKPRTITINGIEVPAPFEPKDGDKCFIVDSEQDDCFYEFVYSENSGFHKNFIQLGVWRTEDEIKQVIAAYRKPIEEYFSK